MLWKSYYDKPQVVTKLEFRKNSNCDRKYLSKNNLTIRGLSVNKRPRKKLHPMQWCRHTDRQTDMATLWLNRPSRADSVKMPTKTVHLPQNLHECPTFLHCVLCEKAMDEIDVQNVPYYQDPLLDNSTFILSFT